MPDLSGGSLVFSAAVTSANQVKGGAGRIILIDLINTTGAVAYLQVFNALSTSVTLGTTTPTYSIGLAASGVKTLSFGENGINHATGITVAGTTTRTGSTTAQIDVNIAYL